MKAPDIFLQKHLRTLLFLMNQKDYDELLLVANSFEVEIIPDVLSDINKLLNSKDFRKAQTLIVDLLAVEQKKEESFVLKRKDEHDIIGIKTVIHLHELQMSVLEFKKAELIRMVTKFRILHNRILGPVISEILKLRVDDLFEKLKMNPDIEPEYNEAIEDYESYHETSSEIGKDNIEELPENEIAELQKLYRKASKLCHPDLVNADIIEDAKIVFIELNKAYISNNLSRVKQICAKLESGELKFIGLTEEITELIKLEQVLSTLKQKIEAQEEEIEMIKQSDACQAILEINDWDNYFEQLKTRLTKELLDFKHKNEKSTITK